MKSVLSVLQIGVENISRLHFLEYLNISHLDVKKWESIHEALGKISRPTMKHLNVSSLPIQWETVEAFGTLMPNLEHLDLSMCILGATDKSIQVKISITDLWQCTLIYSIYSLYAKI